MSVSVISVGVTIIKLAVFGGLGAGIIAGVNWFGKYDPKMRGGKKKNESDSIENLRKAVGR